jgi:CubicO group peptidase (beta-lactamase class C family)
MEGVIRLEKTMEELDIEDVEGLLPLERQATVRDLISARSGVYHPEGYPGGMQEYAPKRGSVEPGTYWLYNNWDFNVAGYIFEKETGRNLYDEVEIRLARPLQMQDWDRSLQRKEGDTTISKYLAYPMWFSTRDMARIGLLMLNRGKWQDQRILAESWVDEMLKQRTGSEEINRNVPFLSNTGVELGYGYMWWLWENHEDKRLYGAYSALGAMGQAITICPEIDAVVVYKTKAIYRRINSVKVRLNLIEKAVKLFTYNKTVKP